MNKKKGRGRPRLVVDLEEVSDLASEGNKLEEIAHVLGISKSTLCGRKDIRDAYDKGRAELAVNVRHWQMECAKSGNASMLMWLGKQYLDQKEKTECGNNGEAVKVIIDV